MAITSQAFETTASRPGKLRNRLVIAATVLLPSGIPFSFVGIPPHLSAQVIQVLLLALSLLRLLQIAQTGRLGRYEIVTILLFTYFILVSATSSSFFYPLPPADWLPGMLIMAPMLFILAANLLRLTFSEVLDGLLIAAVTVGALLSLDQIVRFPFLDQFVAYNSRYGSTRRIVLLHNECAFALPVLLFRCIASQGRTRSLYILATLLVAVAALLISESRLVTASVLISVTAYVAYVRRRDFLPLATALAALVALVALPFVADSAGDFLGLTRDDSVAVRSIEIIHFEKYFENTLGLGFGFMSLSENKNTILSSALYRDPALYGLGDYWFSLVDIRLYAALFQFGWLGLAAVLAMTIATFLSFWRMFNQLPKGKRNDFGALATTTLGFCLSPLPLNMFTVENTVLLGGILWFLASKAKTEASNRSRSASPAP